MAVYAYEAVSANAASIVGTIAADTAHSARRQLRSRGLIVERLVEQKVRTRRPLRAILRRKLSDSSIQITFARELSTLLGVGVPLLEALDNIGSQYRSGRGRVRYFGTAIALLRDRIAEGAGLAEAMRAQPDVFDELCVSLVEVGEDSGTLDSTLERLASFKDRSQQLKGRISTALIYPCIVVVMAVAISIFLMTFVVPSILEPLVDLGRPLPVLTRVVKAGSDLLIEWGWLCALVVVGVGIISRLLVRTARGKHAWHSFLLRLPVLGELIRKQAIVRIAVVIEALLGGGITLVRALQVAQRTAGNVVLKNALCQCERAIAAGSELGAALQSTGAFPPLVVQLFSVGQQSGKLEQMLGRLAEDYDRDVATSSQRLVALLEPLLIVVLALLVLVIAMATMLPILEAGNVLQ